MCICRFWIGPNYFRIGKIVGFYKYCNETSNSKKDEGVYNLLSTVQQVLASWSPIMCGCSNETRSEGHDVGTMLFSCLVYVLIMNMGATFSSETSFDFHQTLSLHSNRCESLKCNYIRRSF
jgi:hypothetical protein